MDKLKLGIIVSYFLLIIILFATGCYEFAGLLIGVSLIGSAFLYKRKKDKPLEKNNENKNNIITENNVINIPNEGSKNFEIVEEYKQ